MFKANFQTVTSTLGCLPTAFLLADRIHLLPQGLKMLASQHPLQFDYGHVTSFGQWTVSRNDACHFQTEAVKNGCFSSDGLGSRKPFGAATRWKRVA